MATTPERSGRPSHGTQTSFRNSAPITAWPFTVARPAPASIRTLTMSSAGTRGAGPIAKVGGARSDHSTSMRRPLAMTASVTVGPASGVDRKVAMVGGRSISFAAQPPGESRPACFSASAGASVSTSLSVPPPRSTSTNASSPTKPSCAHRNR
jgi:hypothetical protein